MSAARACTSCKALIAKILKIPSGELARRHPRRRRRLRHEKHALSRISARSRGRRRLGRSVGWLADRSRAFVGDAQGRDNVTTAEMALDVGGRFLAMRVDILGNLGAYLSQFAPYIPWLGATMATGTYHIDALYARFAASTPIRFRSTPIAARGGRRRLTCSSGWSTHARASSNIAPEEIRARNFVKAPTDALSYADRSRLRRRRFRRRDARLPEEGRLAGFARAPRRRKHAAEIRGIRHFKLHRMHRLGRRRGRLRRTRAGTAISPSLIGTQSNGQGHETAYAQVVSQYLDVPLDRIKVVQGDTDRIPTGNGTGGSRSIPIGAVMVPAPRRRSPPP